MTYMDFSMSNCKNCYKCLRYCPVKAIKFENEKANIVQERCINCGHCLEICPQNARRIYSDLPIVKNAILARKKIVATIAPSFFGHFGESYGKVLSALKKLGFSDLQETALGAEIVTKLYHDYIKGTSKNNYITTCCPSVNHLIEKYFSELIDYVIPINTPMMAHGKIIKKLYGEDTFTIFIGPCIAKKSEADNYLLNDRFIDAVLTYEEIEEWIKEENIDLNSENHIETTNIAFKTGRRYAIHGGIIQAIGNIEGKKLKKISISGIEECIEIFESMKKGYLKNTLVEVSACKGSCVGGPHSIKRNGEYFKKLSSIKEYVNKKENNKIKRYIQVPKDIDFTVKFMPKNIEDKVTTEEEIEKIMNSMGKYSEEDELNCGVCGYDTCREKAIAVYNGMAETNMCLHYMRNKAESMSNFIFEHSGTCVLVLNGELKIKEINPAGEEMFTVKAENVRDKSISVLMNEEDFREVKNTGKSIIGKKIIVPQYDLVFIENIVYLPKQDIIVASMANIVEEEKNRKELLKVKENTFNAAQEVIEKQMRVAQEIASLLGETTAETKITLTKLKKVVEGEEGEIR